MVCGKHFLLCALAVLSYQVTAAGLSLPEATKLWEQSRDRTDYQKYAEEFAVFNNNHRLDEKHGCYSLSPGPVTLFLVIDHDPKQQFAVVGQVVSDSDNAKSRCFKRTYTGIPTKVPPFVPFPMKMQMGR